MADSWGPRQSPTRRLRRGQQSMPLGNLGGKLRQASPVPEDDNYEAPPFNMHVEGTAPDDLYRGRAWMDVSEFELAGDGPLENSTSTAYYGPKRHLAWDGGSQHAFESQTNNPRYYGVQTVKQTPPSVLNTFGELGNTDGQYNAESGFPRGGAVPLVYVNSAVYYLAMYGMVGTAVTRLNEQAYPSQSFSNVGFLRAWVVWPDDPDILAFGWSGSTYNAWTATVDSSNVLGAWTNLGTVTYENRVGSSIRPAVPISDRLAYFPSSPTIIDKVGPRVKDISAQIATLIGSDVVTDYFANARLAPGKLLLTHRSGSYPSFTYKVSQFQVDSPDSISKDWTFSMAPGASGGIIAGYSLLGKVVVYSGDTSVSPVVWSAWYDVGGAGEQSFPSPFLGPTAYGFLSATEPEGYDGGDAWLVGCGYAGTTYMVLQETITPKGVLKIWDGTQWIVASTGLPAE